MPGKISWETVSAPASTTSTMRLTPHADTGGPPHSPLSMSAMSCRARCLACSANGPKSKSRTYGSVRGARGNLRPYRESNQFAAPHESAIGRFCCKSRKIPGDDFFERNEAELCSPINMAPRPLRKSPVRLSPGDEVPHVFIRESHQRPRKILISGGKRLFQQHRSKPESLTSARMSASASCGHCCRDFGDEISSGGQQH
jgi:hypothetical protein